MSAPVTERTRGTRGGTRTATRPATIPAQRAVPAAPSHPVEAPRDAARKAYARRDDRLRRLAGGRSSRTAGPAGRAQFVLLVMVLLVVGLVATLWLSTAAATDSYRLQDARTAARDLSERSERLHREVAAMGSAPELARRAAELGMVPVQDPARLVVAADGSVTVVGEPEAATAPAPVLPPAPPEPAPGPAASGQQPGVTPDGQAPAAQPGAPAEGRPADGDAVQGDAVQGPTSTGTD